MSSTRLHQHTRDQILKAVIAKKFAPLEQAHSKKCQLFADEVHAAIHGASLRRMNRLPQGWLHQTGSFYAYFNGMSAYLRTSKPVRMLANEVDGRFASDHPLTHRFVELEREKTKLQSDRDIATGHARGLLSSCRTVEKLIEVWPEVKPFIPKDSQPAPSALAIPLASLNSMLGLGKP